MTNCVNIEWKNGFGNQLFQYCYGRLLSEQLDCKLTYSGTISEWGGTSLIDLGFIKDNEDIIKRTTENIEVNIDYNRQQAVELENPSNYEYHLEKIRSWFPTIEKTNKTDLVVHLRIGDNGLNIYTDKIELIDLATSSVLNSRSIETKITNSAEFSDDLSGADAITFYNLEITEVGGVGDVVDITKETYTYISPFVDGKVNKNVQIRVSSDLLVKDSNIVIVPEDYDFSNIEETVESTSFV